MHKVISSIYIKQDIAHRSLLINAISQATVKILYASDVGLDYQTISGNMKRIIGSAIEKTKLEGALEELVKNSLINESAGLYRLRDSYRNKLRAIYNIREERINSVLQKYFSGTDIDQQTLKKWFDDMNTHFFCEYSRDWIEDVIGRSENKKTYISAFKSLTDKSLYKKHNIRFDIRQWIGEQYISFLRSNDPNEQLLMWDYANTMFSSQLIAANIFADKSLVDIFQNSTIILDTNVLMYLDLEKDLFSEAYESLETIFEKLNITPIYFYITKEEYDNAINNKIDDIKKVIAKYDQEVLKESDDAFIQTALERNCTEPAYFETFFEQIKTIPQKFNNSLNISILDYYELSKAIDDGKKNKVLIESLNNIYKRGHDYNKNKHLLSHDAGLISGVCFLRDNGKSNTWILTRDGSIHTYSKENIKANSHPIAINLKTLINLLSVSDGGIDFDPTDIMPLFSKFIQNDVIPESDVFQIEDLTRMFEIQDQITQLPKDDIVTLAKEVNKDRLIGIDDHKIALKIQRRIQSYKIDVKDQLSSTTSMYNSTKKIADKMTSEMHTRKKNYFIRRRKELLQSFHNTNRMKIGFSIFGQIIVFALISIGILFLVKQNYTNVNIVLSSIIAVVINVLTNMLSFKTIISSIFANKEKNYYSSLDKILEEEWDKLLVEDVSE